MKIPFLVLSLFLVALAPSPTRAASVEAPDPSLTPGSLCTDNDPNFDDYYYDEQVPRCKRNVPKSLKQKVADEYDVPESDWSDYEFDHLIPLCAGGSSSLSNLWPQPIDEAHDKDKIENSVCSKMRAGTMTQKQAVKQIHDWFDERIQSGKIRRPIGF